MIYHENVYHEYSFCSFNSFIASTAIIVAVSTISVVIVSVANVIAIALVVYLTRRKHSVQSDINTRKLLTRWSSFTTEQQTQPAEEEHILEQPDANSLHCEGNDSKLDERFKGQGYNV